MILRPSTCKRDVRALKLSLIALALANCDPLSALLLSFNQSLWSCALKTDLKAEVDGPV